MSIVSVTEEFGNRSSTVNEMYQRTYVRSFYVETSDPYIGPIAVRTASGIPGIGSHYENGVATLDPRHEYDFGSFVQGVEVEEVEDQIKWRVTVNYGAWNPAVFGSDPTLWPLRAQFGGERTERVIYFDKTGAPVRNSAGNRFVDPITVDDHITTIMLTRNELVSTFDPVLASQLSDTINNATWNGIDAFWAKMGIISTSDEQYDSNGFVWYYKVTYPIQLGRKPWKKDLLDQGYNAKLPGATYPTSMKGSDGQPFADPQLLDGSGHKLVSGSPVTLTYDVFDEADWSVLDLDMSVRLGL